MRHISPPARAPLHAPEHTHAATHEHTTRQHHTHAWHVRVIFQTITYRQARFPGGSFLAHDHVVRTWFSSSLHAGLGGGASFDHHQLFVPPITHAAAGLARQFGHENGAVLPCFRPLARLLLRFLHSCILLCSPHRQTPGDMEHSVSVHGHFLTHPEHVVSARTLAELQVTVSGDKQPGSPVDVPQNHEVQCKSASAVAVAAGSRLVVDVRDSADAWCRLFATALAPGFVKFAAGTWIRFPYGATALVSTSTEYVFVCAEMAISCVQSSHKLTMDCGW